jgi:hypothetical protein
VLQRLFETAAELEAQPRVLVCHRREFGERLVVARRPFVHVQDQLARGQRVVVTAHLVQGLCAAEVGAQRIEGETEGLEPVPSLVDQCERSAHVALRGTRLGE